MTLGFKSKKLLAIDWDKRNVRMAAVRTRAGAFELLKVVTAPIPPEVAVDEPEAMGAFLREAMRQSRIGVKQAIMNIHREQVVLNTLNLPPTPVEEMAALIRYQIVKELPFSAEQATIDFAVGGEHDPNSPCVAMVAAVRNEDLAFYRGVAREAGLSIERIGLRPYANLLAVLGAMPELREKSLLVIEVGPLLTEIDIVQAGALTFSRAASVALPEFPPSHDERDQDSRIAKSAIQNVEPDESSGEAVNSLMVEIVRSVEAYRATNPSMKLDDIVVCGAVGLEGELAESLAARFGARAQLYSPNGMFDLSAQRAKELRGFSAVLGLAAGHELHGIGAFDFLRPKKPVSRRALRMKKAPLAIATAVLLISAAITARVRFVGPEEKKVEDLRAEIANIQKRERPIKTFAKQVKALADWKLSEQYWPEVLVALTGAFPPEEEAFVTRLDLETRPRRKSTKRISTLKLKMRTTRLGMVNEQSEALRRLGFGNVEAGQESRIGATGRGEFYRFDTSLSAELPQRPVPRRVPPSSTMETADTAEAEWNEADSQGATASGDTLAPARAESTEAEDVASRLEELRKAAKKASEGAAKSADDGGRAP